MRRLLKYFLLAAAVQASLCVFLVVIGNAFPSLFFLANSLLMLYRPILDFLALHSTRGESQMVGVPLVGIPLGIILYSLLIAIAFRFLKKR